MNLSEWLLSSNLTQFTFMLNKISLRCHYFNYTCQGRIKFVTQFSGKSDSTVLLTSVVGPQNYIYEKYPLYTIYNVFL